MEVPQQCLQLVLKGIEPVSSYSFLFGSNLRSGVPYIFCRGGEVRLIQLLDNLSVASPESGLFSDWSRNKKALRTET